MLGNDCEGDAVMDPGSDAQPAGDILASKSKPAAKAKGKSSKPLAGRRKSGNSKNLRICKACQCKKPESEFALNQAVDMECKRFLDNIGKQARAQGPDAIRFFQESKADPAKCKKMLESYKAAYKAWVTNSKQGKVKWCMIQYKESVEAQTGVRLSENQQMMWERQAVLFWQSVDGGCLTEEEAQARWSKLAARVGEEGCIFDYKGPERKPLRLAITREDMVYNYNEVSKKRSVDFLEKAQKKVDDAGLQKTLKRVMTSHDQIGGSSAVSTIIPDSEGLAQMMVQGGAGSAFDAANMKVGDVKNLMPMCDEEPATPVKDKADAAALGSEDDGVEASEDEKTKRRWFDEDRAVNAAHKALAAQRKKLMATHAQKIEELEAALKMIGDLGANDKVHYQGEEKIAQVRVKFLRALGGTAKELSELIEQFQAPSASPAKGLVGDAAVDSATTVNAIAALGNAPPCKQFAELRLLAELSLSEDEVLQCNTAEEIVEHKKSFARLKAPVSELLSSAQAGRFTRISRFGVCGFGFVDFLLA